MELACLISHPGGCVLLLRVTPGARRTAAEGVRAGRLALRVQAPPVEGQANAAAIRWAAATFGVRATAVHLLRGARGRQKDLLIEGVEPEAAAERLARRLEPPTPTA